MERIIRCAADAKGLDFLVADDLLDADGCDRLAAIYRASAHLYEDGNADPFWNGRILRHRDVEPQARALMFEAAKRGIGKAQAFYLVCAPLFPDITDLVGWPQGLSMPVHADRDGQPAQYDHREFSGLLYLNEDFAGGELYIPSLGVAIQPRRGMFVSLPSGNSHAHGVREVTRGQRITVSFFLTFDASRAMPRPAS